MNPEASIAGGVHGPDRTGTDAARQLGAELVAKVDLDALGARIAALPTAALLAELEGIVEALDNQDPVRRRRRAGLLGRLLGRDLIAQAQPDPVDQRVRLRLSAAQAVAANLAVRAEELKSVAAALQGHIDQLNALLARQYRVTSEGLGVEAQTARSRRLADLDAILASWRITAAQLALLDTHAALLLDRHAQVRDLLVPLWRQRAVVDGSVLRDQSAARLGSAMRAQVVSLRETIRPSSAHERADGDHPPKEPSP